MPLRPVLLASSLCILAACGGGGGNSTPPPPPPVDETPVITGARTALNNARLAQLLTLRAECGGPALPTVTTDDHLITAAVRHAGWQALYDKKHGGASLSHTEGQAFRQDGEPLDDDQKLPLYTDYYPWDRMVAAGVPYGPTIPMAEDIASMSDGTTMGFLWNTVYHRVPMMMHAFTSIGYGDMALARSEYPTVGIPAISPWDGTGNGYATLDWFGVSHPNVTQSWWPRNGTEEVPYVFSSDTEKPDPAPEPGLNEVGPPLHAVFPTLHYIKSITARLRPGDGGADIPLRILVGIGLGNTDPVPIPTGIGANYKLDDELDVGQIFLVPLIPLNADDEYIWSCTVTDTTDAGFTTSDCTFTTSAFAPAPRRPLPALPPTRSGGAATPRAGMQAAPTMFPAALARAYAVLGAAQDGTRTDTPLDTEAQRYRDQALELLAQDALHANPAASAVCPSPGRGPLPIHGDADKVLTAPDAWVAIPGDPQQNTGRPLTIRNASDGDYGFCLTGRDFASVRVNGGLVVPGRFYRLDGTITITNAMPVGVQIRPLGAIGRFADAPRQPPTGIN